MTLLHEIKWQASLIEPYRDPDAEALMRKKYGFVMDSVAFCSRNPLSFAQWSPEALLAKRIISGSLEQVRCFGTASL